MDHTIGFLGGGRITAVFLNAWESRGLNLNRVLVSDQEPSVLDPLKAHCRGIETTQDNGRSAAQDIVFLALHPPVLKAVLPTLIHEFRPGTIVVSLAPVVTMAKLSSLMGGHDRLVRMIPNAPSMVSRGFNPTAYGPGITLEDKQSLEPLFEILGEFPEVPEEELEAYAILTAMGPTYFWFQIQALRDLGQSFGLAPGAVDRALAAMLHGATDLLLERGLSFEAVDNTIPVKPLQDAQADISAHIRGHLVPLYRKLKGL